MRAEAGVSVGVVAVGTGAVRIERSTVNASDGGRGVDGDVTRLPMLMPQPADAGDDADGRDAGDGAAGDGPRVGGDGGRGGSTSDGEDAPGSRRWRRRNH